MGDEYETESVSIGDEIRCLLDAGWTWDGDKLVHPEHKDVWTMYIRTFSHMSRVEQFDAEIAQAVRKAQQKDQG